ncbi:hypothetical protein evm_012634 [Chilo suppressalis]|nr:hypothetical protein evm_012634 [Chilo suppressalis]
MRNDLNCFMNTLEMPSQPSVHTVLRLIIKRSTSSSSVFNIANDAVLVAGVAVLVCNATAASFWAQDGWTLNKNPAATAYRIMWSTLEPMVFAYSGTFFEINKNLANVLLPGFGILAVCLFVRLAVAYLTCWDFTFREKIFICCTWMPKSIVEAVLCPVALDTIAALGDRGNTMERQWAENIMQLLIQLILITTPIGFLLTNHLGPILLKTRHKDCEIIERRSQRKNSIHRSQDEERM